VIPPDLPVIGFIVLFLGATTAIADRRQREYEELVRLRHDLEELVDERTAELSAANRQLEEMARSDWLTGLPNRRGFLAAVEAEERRSRRSGRPFSVALGDLDHFKRVNDEHGHATGDAVLQAVATAVRGALREQDLVARWGGEELIMLLPETGLAGAVAAAGAVREAVSAVQLAAADKRLAPLTISVGVAEHRPDRSLEATIAAADRALYRAKAEGRDRVAAD
jgi:diguanylate cyclase